MWYQNEEGVYVYTENNLFINVPNGEYMLRWIGTGEICFDFPVILSVSSAISLRTMAAEEIDG